MITPLAFLGIPIGFAFPWALLALAFLPIIWWLLRLTPPHPKSEPFPPTRILAELISREETPAHSPWWLTMLRLMMAIMIIFAMALPVWKPQNTNLTGKGPLLLVIENGWASGADWQKRIDTAKSIVIDAQAANRQIIVIKTLSPADKKIEITSAEVLKTQLASWENHPIEPDYARTAKLIAQAIEKFSPTSLVFLSDGIAHLGLENLAAKFQLNSGQKILYLSDTDNTVAINSVRNQPDIMVGEIIRADKSGPKIVNIVANDIKGISITRQQVKFGSGEKSASFAFNIPVELRNDVVRVFINEAQNAGSVHLLDESNRRRLVGLISGEKHDNAQPLLSPLYYISRALEPFSDIRRSRDANIAKAVPELITRGVSTIVLADIGLLPEETSQKLQEWVNNGGMLIRFAGPRLAAAPHNSLLPVRLREGDRNLGGALSWDKPKPLANFELTSPFFGLEPPREVFITRQVLAIQESGLAQKTWSRLSDGTPLVTASKLGQGWRVLFHVNSDASWSNLPISGTFVEMLRRIVNQSRSSLTHTAATKIQSLPPMRLLNGKGQLTAPGIEAKPVNLTGGKMPEPSLENPPGFYGTQEGFRALNLFNGNGEIKLLDADLFGDNTTIVHYANRQPLSLRPWALLALALLLILDCVAVLWMAGQIRIGNMADYFKAKTTGSTFTSAFIFSICIAASGNFFDINARAQTQTSSDSEQQIDALSPDFDFSPSLRTRLAYVITGIGEVDDTSLAGLTGLTKFLTDRTAIEPAQPIGVDISRDELAFYPMIYWPIHISSQLPDAQTMARIDAYMKQGGSIIFDTRNQISGFTGTGSSSQEAFKLQQILANLDIPSLEPVPEDHVLTKSFFILAEFPGRYSGGQLWVEQLPDENRNGERPVRVGDGVSSILITSNDFAGAWAIDQQLRPMFPIVPPNPIQREIAFRVGVNLVMYAMTGNYKSDQVHIPALLERLGQ